jgi:hypothetical protein
VLFTFPSRYWFTIGRQRVFSLAGWSRRVPTGFLVSRGTQVPAQRAGVVFVYRTVTFYGSTFQRTSTNDPVGNSPALRPSRPYNPREHAPWFGLFRVRSPLLAESLLFSVPSGTEMVHFPELPSCAYVFSAGCSGITRSGFPHSEIPGSKLVCSSPRLIAAYRVLHRLLAPRHSPYALSSLTK